VPPPGRVAIFLRGVSLTQLESLPVLPLLRSSQAIGPASSRLTPARDSCVAVGIGIAFGLCYNLLMPKTLAKPTKRPAKPYTIGQRAFAKISAVEGIHLSAEMERDLREFDRNGLSAEERRAYIAHKYGKVR
jgi:hypothetical protein